MEKPLKNIQVRESDKMIGLACELYGIDLTSFEGKFIEE